MAARTTGGPRRSGGWPAEPTPPPRLPGPGGPGDEPGDDQQGPLEITPANPGWWALFTWTPEGVALPVVGWRIFSISSEPDDSPHFMGIVPGGFGHWDFADLMDGFIDYAYHPAPSGTPPSAFIRHHCEIVSAQYGNQPDEWPPIQHVRAWLRGETSTSSE